MIYLQYLVIGAAIFLVGAWTFGLIYSPRNRIGSTILTVMLWWVGLTAWFFGSFSVFHLLWIYPAALVLPVLLLAGSRTL